MASTTTKTPKRKTKSQLVKEKIHRLKSARKPGHQKRSRIAKLAAKKMSKAARHKRALKAAKTRKKLYGKKGHA